MPPRGRRQQPNGGGSHAEPHGNGARQLIELGARVMVPDLLSRATTSKGGTPIGAAGRGIAGGLAGALLLSIVSRMLPVLRTQRTPVPTGRSADAFQPTLAQALTVRSPLGRKAWPNSSPSRSRQVSSGATSAPAPGWRDGSSTWPMAPRGACFMVSSRPATRDRPRPLAQSMGSWSGSSDRRSSCRRCGSWDDLQRSR